jgi:hypothetical protein
MNKPAVQEPAQEPTQKKQAPAPTRDEIRAKLLGKTPLAKSKMITLFGMELELKQPTLEAILKTRDTEDNTARAVDMIIEYAFVPGTDEHVFESADREMMLRWPFGKDLTDLNEAIAELTGVDITAVVEDMKRDPLEG